MQISNGVNTIVLSDDNGVAITSLVKSNIKALYKDYVPAGTAGLGYPSQYPYPSLTVVVIELSDGSKERIELQDITNQPAWSDGSEADLNTAFTDMNSWL